jgi:hypothetical protein
VDSFLYDLRQAARGLVRRPGFVAVVDGRATRVDPAVVLRAA